MDADVSHTGTTSDEAVDTAPDEEPPPANASAPEPEPEASPEPEPTRQRRRRRWLRWIAFATSVFVLAAAGAGWMLYQQLNGNIRTDKDTAEELARHEDERPAAAGGEVQNILLLGSDSRDGENAAYGQGGTERADTTILLHLPADRSHATAVSLPRDLMVDIPGCRKPDGDVGMARTAQFNWAFEYGGAACTIRTVEQLTGIRMDHHLIVDFSGFQDIVDAVGGVEVCLREDIRDRDAKLDLDSGRQILSGEDALGYVRARKSFDGSDTQRMERQQQFLGSLVKKTRSNGVLLNPTKLYPVLDAATSALTTDTGLDSLRELYDLARSLREIPEERVRFLTVPRRPYALDGNRDELVQPEADRLFTLLREDEPVPVDNGYGSGSGSGSDSDSGSDSGSSSGASKASPSPEATPTYRGTTAARDVCAQDSTGNEAY